MNMPLRLVAPLLLFLAPFAARAAEPLKLNLVMEVYAGGLNIMTVESATEIADGRYAMTVKSQTKGMANFLTRFQLDTFSEGRVGPDGAVPRSFRSDSNGRLGRRVAEVEWTGEGTARAARLEPGLDEEDRVPVTEAQRRDTVDPLLAGIIRATTTLTSEPCKGVARVFDGRRRYDLFFEPAEEEFIVSTRYSAYAGEAMKCAVRFKTIAGQKRNDANDAEKAAQNPITLWLTSTVDRRLWLPVRLEVNNPVGDIVIHLVKAVIDGKTRLDLAE